MQIDDKLWASAASRLDEGCTGGQTAEQKLVEEILADEAFVGQRLDVEMPAGTLFRVSARLQESLARRHAHHANWLWKSITAAAAAAIVVAGLVLFSLDRTHPVQEPRQVAARLTAAEAADAYLAGTAVADDLEMEVEAMGAVAEYMYVTAQLFHPASFQPAYVDPGDPQEEIFLDPWIFGVDSIPEM